jgi:4-amino-4-deoxy-L-arabinose transferase-like glycosyltransferase
MNREPGAAVSFRSGAGVFLAIGLLVFPIVLGLGMTQDLTRDEHQHVAAGAFVAREGLLPYRDFPHFHTPYLPFVYALLFRATDHLVNAARLLSVLAGTGILAVLGAIAWQLFRGRGRAFAATTAAATVLLALSTTLFSEHTGRAWNHEPALFLTLLAVVAHLAGLRSAGWAWFVISGGLLGLAIGTRITCAPLIAPFGLALWLFPPPLAWRWHRVAGFSTGLLLGLAGVLWFFAVVPEQAVYANFGFAETNILYRFSTGEPRTMTLAKKLRFFWKEIVRPDAALFLAGLLPILVAYFANRSAASRWRWELRFLFLLLPFVFIGSFAPSPVFEQYFYPMVPLMVLAGLYAWASISTASGWFRRCQVVGIAATVLSVALGLRAFADFRNYFVPREWSGTKLHDRSQELRAHVTSGKILTLVPSYALEAGLSIYPALSTGVFAWRVSPYVEPARAARLGLLAPTTLAAALAADPPAGVLIGFEKKGEEPLAEWAASHGYEARPLPKERQLWVKR